MGTNDDTERSAQHNESTNKISFTDKIKIKSIEVYNSTKNGIHKGITAFIKWSKETAHKIKVNTKAGLKWLDSHHFIQFIIAILISALGIFLSLRMFDPQQNTTIWMYIMIGVGIIAGIALWIYAAQKIFGKLLFYVVEHKFTRKIIAGGSFSYYEYEGPEEVSIVRRFTEPIGILITSLIAFLGLATTAIGIVRIFSPNLDTAGPILWGILAILTPILATPIIPIAWILDDARVKAWNEKHQTTWRVSKKYKRRLNSFIAVGAIISNLRSGISASSMVKQLEILFGILQTGVLIMFISLGFFIIFYYAWYRNYLRIIAYENLNLECYKVILEEHEVTNSMAFKQLKEIEKITDDPEEEPKEDTDQAVDEEELEKDEEPSDTTETESVESKKSVVLEEDPEGEELSETTETKNHTTDEKEF